MRKIEFPSKDSPLREDVSLLGNLVGEMLREQGGDALFRTVEKARQAAIVRRESGREEELESLVDSLSPDQSTWLVRAFAAYFQVANLAQKVHRIRRGREYLRRAHEAQPDSLEDFLLRLRQQGSSLEQIRELLDRMLIEPVFTAHPTESTRRSILEKEQRIARRLLERLNPSMTPPEEQACLARIRSEITAAWQTEEFPAMRPLVRDEREHVLFYLTDILYRIVPAFYERLEEALVRAFGDPAGTIQAPPILRFASWVGGDMDGNPNVTQATIRESLADHRDQLLRLYRREVKDLSRHLSQSLSRVGVSPQMLDRIEEYERILPEKAEALPERHRNMPYRRLLRFMAARLEASSLDDPSRGYSDSQEFCRDLRMIAHSLEFNKGAQAGLFQVRRTLRRAQTFGFHLAALDVRQDALVHRSALAGLLREAQWLSLDPQERTQRLRDLSDSPSAFSQPDQEAGQTLDVFRAIADCRRLYGEQAVGAFIVSMTQGADDVLSVLQLARLAGLEQDGCIPLDVAPLLETVPDLQAAPAIFRDLMSDPTYRAHLEKRGKRQMVMVG